MGVCFCVCLALKKRMWILFVKTIVVSILMMRSAIYHHCFDTWDKPNITCTGAPLVHDH